MHTAKIRSHDFDVTPISKHQKVVKAPSGKVNFPKSNRILDPEDAVIPSLVLVGIDCRLT